MDIQREELGDWNTIGKDQKRLLNYTGNINNPTRVIGVNPHLKDIENKKTY